jgi:hypothetical protein
MTASIVQPYEKDLTKFADALKGLAEGRSNATGTVTLRASQTTTTVTAPNCGAGSVVLLSPTTSNAAAAIATTYVSTVAGGSFILTHASNAQTDKIFGWVCLG